LPLPGEGRIHARPGCRQRWVGGDGALKGVGQGKVVSRPGGEGQGQHSGERRASEKGHETAREE